MQLGQVGATSPGICEQGVPASHGNPPASSILFPSLVKHSCSPVALGFRNAMQPEVLLCRKDGLRLAVNASAPLMLGREHHSSMSPHISRHAATYLVGIMMYLLCMSLPVKPYHRDSRIVQAAVHARAL